MFLHCLTAGFTGKGGILRTKPPDAESARLPRVPGGVGAADPKVQALGAGGVGQILQDGFEFELNISMIHCIYRRAENDDKLVQGNLCNNETAKPASSEAI